MTFTSKKEADAFDKMLDISDSLIPFLQNSTLEFDEQTCEKLAFYLAERKDDLLNLLKGTPIKDINKPIKNSKKQQSTARAPKEQVAS